MVTLPIQTVSVYGYKMPIAEVDEILKKFKTEEDKITQILKEKNFDTICENNEDTKVKIIKDVVLTPQEAKERNAQLLKELETVKGNLRSKAIFSPSELQWEKICKQYQQQRSLPVTTWRCLLPVYV